MIKSFTHKGLKELFLNGITKGVKQEHVKRLRILLFFLDKMQTLNELNGGIFGLHPLKGALKGYYSIKVSGNYRLTFIWKEETKEVEILNYLDYH